LLGGDEMGPVAVLGGRRSRRPALQMRIGHGDLGHPVRSAIPAAHVAPRVRRVRRRRVERDLALVSSLALGSAGLFCLTAVLQDLRSALALLGFSTVMAVVVRISRPSGQP